MGKKPSLHQGSTPGGVRKSGTLDKVVGESSGLANENDDGSTKGKVGQADWGQGSTRWA